MFWVVHLMFWDASWATSCQTCLCGSTQGIRQAVDLPHDLFPGLVHLKEHLRLSRQLPLDVRSTENTLKIKPASLTCQPLILGTQQKQIRERLISDVKKKLLKKGVCFRQLPLKPKKQNRTKQNPKTKTKNDLALVLFLVITTLVWLPRSGWREKAVSATCPLWPWWGLRNGMMQLWPHWLYCHREAPRGFTFTQTEYKYS